MSPVVAVVLLVIITLLMVGTVFLWLEGHVDGRQTHPTASFDVVACDPADDVEELRIKLVSTDRAVHGDEIDLRVTTTPGGVLVGENRSVDPRGFDRWRSGVAHPFGIHVEGDPTERTDLEADTAYQVNAIHAPSGKLVGVLTARC